MAVRLTLYERDSGGWGYAPAVKSTDCLSSKGPGFDSQHWHGGSQSSLPPDPKDLMPSSGICSMMPSCGRVTDTHKDVNTK